MAHAQQPQLIWLTHPRTRCPLSGEALYQETVELGIESDDLLLADWTLGRCAESPRWYGLLEDLLDVLTAENVPLDTVDGFLLDDVAVESGLWMDEAGAVLPWSMIRTSLEGLQAYPMPPTPEEVQALPLLSESWEIGLGVVALFLDEDRQETPGYAALVLDPVSGVRHHDLRPGTPHRAQDLVPLILAAAVRPHIGTPGRPLEIHIADETLARTLAGLLSALDIRVQAAPTPRAEAVLDEMISSLRREDAPPFFTPYDEPAVRAFFRAATAFYRTRPWERIDGDRYVGFRIGDGPWGYLSVLGQMGEEHGLSFFEDWLQLCRFLYNQPTPWDYIHGADETQAFEAAGAMEGLTLEPLSSLHPDDAAYLETLGVKPPRKEGYPLPRRFTLDGLEAPLLSLSDYQVLMQALTEAISKRRAQRITSIKQIVTVGDVPVTLRYPAKGNEALAEKPGHFRMIVTGQDRGGPFRIEIDAPGDTRLDNVAHAVSKAEKGAHYVTGFRAGAHAAWNNSQGSGGPCPRVAHLAPLSPLALEILGEAYPVQLMPWMAADASKVRVRVVR